MNRDALIEDGCDALPLVVWRELSMEDVVGYVLDAVEPLIRVDETQKAEAAAVEIARRDQADLRAKVLALHLMSDADHVYEDGYEAAKRDVLDLFDGSDK